MLCCILSYYDFPYVLLGCDIMICHYMSINAHEYLIEEMSILDAISAEAKVIMMIIIQYRRSRLKKFDVERKFNL